SNAVPDWRNSLRRRGGSRRRTDLGIISLRNLLAHARRVGNEPYRIFAKSGAPAHLAHGRGLAAPWRTSAPTSFMDSLRPSLGVDRGDEYGSHLHDTFLLALAAVSKRSIRKFVSLSVNILEHFCFIVSNARDIFGSGRHNSTSSADTI